MRESFTDVTLAQDETHAWFLLNLLQSATLSGDAGFVRDILARFIPLADDIIGTVSIGRVCGEASALLGQPDAARSYYSQALDVCEKVRFRPEIALIRLDLAELLLEHYPDEREAAIEDLDFAIAEFRER